MKKSSLWRVSTFFLTFFLVGLFVCPAQTEKEVLTMTRKEMSEFNYQNIVKAYLKACVNDPNPNNYACKGLSDFEDRPETYAEVYQQVLKGDNSLTDAGYNEFKMKKARQVIAQKEGQIKSDILSMPNAYQAVRQLTIKSRDYDFDTETIKIKPEIKGKTPGHMDAIIDLKGNDGQSPFVATLKLPISEAEKLFDNKYADFDAVWVITFKDAVSNSGIGAEATIQSIKLYEKKTGRVVSEQNY